MKLLQLAAGIDTQFPSEMPAYVLVGTEGIRLPTGAVEGEHLQLTKAFTQRVCRDQQGQVGRLDRELRR